MVRRNSASAMALTLDRPLHFYVGVEGLPKRRQRELVESVSFLDAWLPKTRKKIIVRVERGEAAEWVEVRGIEKLTSWRFMRFPLTPGVTAGNMARAIHGAIGSAIIRRGFRWEEWLEPL